MFGYLQEVRELKEQVISMKIVHLELWCRVVAKTNCTMVEVFSRMPTGHHLRRSDWYSDRDKSPHSAWKDVFSCSSVIFFVVKMSCNL